MKTQYKYLSVLCAWLAGAVACSDRGLNQRGQGSSLSDTGSRDATGPASDSGEVKTGSASHVEAGGESGVKGASATFQTGSVNADTNVQVGSGAAVSNDISGAYLGFPPGTQPGGPAVAVTSSNPNAQVVQPFVLQLPETAAGLIAIDDKRIAILFRAKTAAGGEVGVIPSSLLRRTPAGIEFDATRFGTYQIARLAADCDAPKVATVAASLMTNAEYSKTSNMSFAKTPEVSAATTGEGLITIEVLPEQAGSLASCLIVADRDQVAPYDYSYLVIEPPSPITALFKAGIGGTYFAKVQCETKSGIISAYSSWSSPGALLTESSRTATRSRGTVIISDTDPVASTETAPILTTGGVPTAGTAETAAASTTSVSTTTSISKVSTTTGKTVDATVVLSADVSAALH